MRSGKRFRSYKSTSVLQLFERLSIEPEIALIDDGLLARGFAFERDPVSAGLERFEFGAGVERRAARHRPRPRDGTLAQRPLALKLTVLARVSGELGPSGVHLRVRLIDAEFDVVITSGGSDPLL